MSTSYQRSIQEDFDDDGADAMEYEPSEKSLDQKSLLEEIPEPFQYENTNETLEASQGLPGTSYFGHPHTVPGSQYYNHTQDGSRDMSSFLNLSDSVSHKENRATNESRTEVTKREQELQGQIVELKRNLGFTKQELMYAKQKNEKLNNELNGLRSSTPTSDNSNLKAIISENQILKEKLSEAENEISQMKEYIEEELKDPNHSQFFDLMQRQKDENEKLQDEKNQLLDFVEQSIQEHESLVEKLENLKKENFDLKDEINSLKNTHNRSKSDQDKYDENRHNFDTFGGEDEDHVSRIQLQKAQETIEKLREDLQKTTDQRNIENRSKDTDIKNLRQKLEIAEKANDDLEACIKEMEEHYKQEIENVQKALDIAKANLRNNSDGKQEYEAKVDELRVENGELSNKYKKIKDNYNTLEVTCNETQAELEELREKYDALSKDTSVKDKVHDLKIQCQQFEKENETLTTLNSQQAKTIDQKSNKIADLTEQIRTAESQIEKFSRENTRLMRELDIAKNVTEQEQYQSLLEDYHHMQSKLTTKEKEFNEIKHDFSKKLNEFQHLSQDFHDLKRAYQDLEYSHQNLETQK